MRKRTVSASLLLLVFLFTAGCQSGGASSPAPSAGPTVSLSPEPTVTVMPTPEPDPIAEQVAAMTVEEKVGQLLIAGFEGTEVGENARQLIQDYRVGGLILFGRNIASADQLVTLTNGLKALNGDAVPLFVCVDQEGGRVDRMPPEIHRTPSAYTVGQTGLASTAQAYGEALGAECAAFGFNLDFAPALDVWTNPNNTVIGDRSFGTDPGFVANGGSIAAAGLSDAGVIPVAKHFPGHGDTAADSHVELPVLDKSLETWDESDFPPFGGYMDRNAAPMMVGHILFPALDDVYPASLSRKIVTDFLRTKQRFDKVLFTDDMTMGAITQNYGLGEACVLAIEAGCDVALVCHGLDNVTAARSALLEAAASGRISQERLGQSVYRILSLKSEYALTNKAVAFPDLESLNAQIDGLLAFPGSTG